MSLLWKMRLQPAHRKGFSGSVAVSSFGIVSCSVSVSLSDIIGVVVCLSTTSDLSFSIFIGDEQALELDPEQSLSLSGVASISVGVLSSFLFSVN